jgi:hypothetical protein
MFCVKMPSKYHATSRAHCQLYSKPVYGLFAYYSFHFFATQSGWTRTDTGLTRRIFFDGSCNRYFTIEWSKKLRKQLDTHWHRRIPRAVSRIFLFRMKRLPFDKKISSLQKERSFHFPQINRTPRLLRQLIRLQLPPSHRERTVFASSVSHIPAIPEIRDSSSARNCLS